MKVLVVIVSVLVAVVLGATDPTSVCLPDRLQVNIYNFLTDLAGVAYVDFPDDELAIVYSNNIRTVYNLTDFSGVRINETTGECRKLKDTESIRNVVTKCLPANAVQVRNASINIGIGDDSTELQVFRISIPGVARVGVTLTKSVPAFPVLREYRSEINPQTDVIFFTNPQLIISDQSVFDVPAVCTSGTVVG